jgi:hypothetical protein
LPFRSNACLQIKFYPRHNLCFILSYIIAIFKYLGYAETVKFGVVTSESWNLVQPSETI